MKPLVLIVTIVGFVACVDAGTGPQPKKVEPGYVGKHLLQAPPSSLAHRVDADLGGKVVYLGNNVDVGRLIPGQTAKVTHYWKVVAPVGKGWSVFMLLRGAPGTADFMNLPTTEMQRAHGPATWAAGEIIEDEHEITLRPDWRSYEATLYVGLIATGEHGIGDRMNATGPNTKDRAVIARKLEVDLSRAPPPAGTIHVNHAQGAIVIDGVLGDPGWAGIAASPEFAAAEGSPDPIGKATARMTWDTDHLYVFANVVDTDILSEFKNQDDPLWKADCIEMFIDADNNKRGYVELQVNPNNATFDSWFPAGRAAKGDEAWDSGMITAVKANGTANAGDSDQGWDVEIAIPWVAIKGRDEAMNVQLPPKVGDRWRLNLVRADKRTGSNNPSASSWNRITYDWHALDRMLTVVYADTLGGVVPNSPVDPRQPVPAIDDGSGSGSAAGSGAGSPAGSGAGSAHGSGAGSGNAIVPPGGAIRMGTGDVVNRAAGSGAGGAAGSAATKPTPPAAGSAAPKPTPPAAGSAAPKPTPPAAGSAAPKPPAAGSASAPATQPL